MVNIPSNLQAIWNEVSKDGKIDKADRDKLLTEAKSTDGISTEEQDFLNNFESLTTSETSIAVKTGNASGTFEFVDQVKFPTQTKPKEESQNTGKYYEPVTLGGSSSKPVTTEEPKKPETDNTSNTTQSPKVEENQTKPETSPTSSESPLTPDEQKELARLKELRNTIASQLQDPKDPAKIDVSPQLKEIDDKIKVLEDKAKGSSPVAPAPSSPPASSAPSATMKKDIENLNNLYDLKSKVENLLTNPNMAPQEKAEAQQQLEVAGKKISELETKIKNSMLSDIKGLTGRVASPDFNKDRDTIKANYSTLPDSLKNDPEIKSGVESLSNVTPKQKLFAEINDVISIATEAAMKTGDMHKFTIAKNEIQKLIDKNPELKGDAQIQNILSILNGEPPTDKGSNYVYRAIDTINNTNKLLSKSTWTKADYAKAQEILNEKNDKSSKEGENFFIDGPFRQRLESRISSYDSNKASEKEKNQKTTISGINDVLGNGFLNAKNKDGASAIFQSLASKNELDETLKRMKAADQIKAIKMLGESKDQFDLAIAKKIYDNLSKISNVDDELKPELRNRLKGLKSDELNKYPISENSFYKGLQYSMYSEKEAAMTMIRSLIDGNVSSKVLNRFNSEEMGLMKDLVNKHGSPTEKEEFLSLIGSNYAKGDAPNIEFMSKEEKSQVIKRTLDNDHIDESKFSDLINKSGKKAVIDVVKNNDLNDKQLALLAKYSDGDQMTDEPRVAAKMLTSMIREFNKGQSNISINDIKNFVNEIEKDWFDDWDVMERVLKELGDGANSEYAKFSSTSEGAELLRKMTKISVKD